jgi:hypothetical protein
MTDIPKLPVEITGSSAAETDAGYPKLAGADSAAPDFAAADSAAAESSLEKVVPDEQLGRAAGGGEPVGYPQLADLPTPAAPPTDSPAGELGGELGGSPTGELGGELGGERVPVAGGIGERHLAEERARIADDLGPPADDADVDSTAPEERRSVESTDAGRERRSDER